MLSKLYAKLWALIFYKLLIYASKHVSFSDFTQIWNVAYQAHAEDAWRRLARLTNSQSIKSQQDELEDSQGVTQKGLPSNLTL